MRRSLTISALSIILILIQTQISGGGLWWPAIWLVLGSAGRLSWRGTVMVAVLAGMAMEPFSRAHFGNIAGPLILCSLGLSFAAARFFDPRSLSMYLWTFFAVFALFGLRTLFIAITNPALAPESAAALPGLFVINGAGTLAVVALTRRSKKM